MHHSVRWVLVASSLLIALAARADEAADLRRLQATGNHAAALERADRYLASKPGDAQVRFLRGVSLTELHRSAEAIAAFRALTEDHPELAEPYNNLAALYAAQGAYDKARAALEQALRANPDYAVAHENLGDVYALLASQSWSRAAQLDPENRGAATKLALARDLLRLPSAR